MSFQKKKQPADKPAPKPEALEELEEVEPIEEVEALEEVEPVEEVKEISPALELDDDDDDDGVEEAIAEATTKQETAKPADVKAQGADSQEAYVVVADAEGHETVFALDKAVLTFGREDKCNIVIPDKKASRKHFVIEMAGDFYNIIDAGSTNGTKVNGKKIAGTQRLAKGDTVVVGQFKITYHGPSDRPAPEPRTKVEPNEIEELPEAPSAPRKKAAPEAPLADDSVTCPECKKDMPENAQCECGYKSLKLRAQEHFVDTIARGESILGGLGLWKLKRQKALEKAFAEEDVNWVLEVVCDACGKRLRAMNEFRVKCEKCECGKELSLPVEDPPKLD